MVEFSVEPGPGFEPVSAHRAIGDPQGDGDVLLGHSGEEAALHHPRPPRAVASQSLESSVEVEELLSLFNNGSIESVAQGSIELVEIHSSSAVAALGGGMAPRLVDQNLAHGGGGGGKEMTAIVPHSVLLACQLQIGFVDQRGGAQGLAGAPASQLRAGDAPEFVVDDRNQPIKGPGVSLLEASQPLGHFTGCHT